jgi:hypothetical protein
VCGSEGYVYVADNQDGVEVLDVSHPSAPREAGAYRRTGATHDIFCDGGLMYLAAAGKGLVVLEFREGP